MATNQKVRGSSPLRRAKKCESHLRFAFFVVASETMNPREVTQLPAADARRCESYKFVYMIARVGVQSPLRFKQSHLRFAFFVVASDTFSVAYWYLDTLDDVYPPMPTPNELEII